MADQQSNGGGNGADDSTQPSVTILAQYVKDLSVENPSAPEVYSWQVQPQLDVQFNLNVQGAGEGVHEVTLKFDVSARSDNGVHFVIDLSYAGIFGVRNVPAATLIVRQRARDVSAIRPSSRIQNRAAVLQLAIPGTPSPKRCGMMHSPVSALRIA